MYVTYLCLYQIKSRTFIHPFKHFETQTCCRYSSQLMIDTIDLPINLDRESCQGQTRTVIKCQGHS